VHGDARACYRDRRVIRYRRSNAVVLLALMALPLGLSACKSEEERSVELVEEMANLFDEHKANCDLLGSEFESFATVNALRFDGLKKLGRLEGEPRKAFDAKYGTRLEKAMRKLMDGATACMDNPKVESALKRIQ
jgi:hypothetical protein